MDYNCTKYVNGFCMHMKEHELEKNAEDAGIDIDTYASLNRVVMYVLENGLRGIDPDGFSLHETIKKIVTITKGAKK